MVQAQYEYYLRQCRRCDEIFKSESKRGRICSNCFKPLGRKCLEVKNE
jgi:protein-arginine kinase activator protein McsA